MGTSSFRAAPLRAALLLALASVLALALTALAGAATPPAGTVSTGTRTTTFTGTLTTPNPAFECPSQADDPANTVCEHYTLTVVGAGGVQVCVAFDDPAGVNDVDVFVYDSGGNQIAAGDSVDMNPECASFDNPGGTMTYEIRINPVFVTGPTTIDGTVTFRPTGGGGGQGGGGIDPPISVGDARVREGDAGSVNATFAVTMDWATSVPVTVDYVTTDETTTTALDYTPATGVVVFAPGETRKTVTVPVSGDTADELNERFEVHLFLPVVPIAVARLEDATGVGTIVDDDSRRWVYGWGTASGLVGGGRFSVQIGENGSTRVYLYRSGVSFRSSSSGTVAFADLTRSVTVTGSGWKNGQPVTYVLQVADNGSPSLDTFVLTLSDGTTASGPLSSGDLRYLS